MLHYKLDPTQMDIVSIPDDIKIVSIAGPSGAGKKTAVLAKANADLQDGKTTLVIYSKQHKNNAYAQALSDLGLQYCSVVFDPNHHQDVEGLSKIRAIEKQEHSLKQDDQYLIHSYDYQYHKEKIEHAYAQLTKSSFGQMNWSQLVKQFLIAKSICPDQWIDAHLIDENYEFSKQEYWLIKGRIEKAAEIFAAKYIYQEQNFSDEVFLNYQNDDQIHKLHEVLSEFQQETVHIIQAFKAFFNQKSKEISQQLTEEFQEIVALKNVIVREINLYFLKEENFNKEMKLFGFGNNYRVQNKLAIENIHSKLIQLKSLITKADWTGISTDNFPEILQDDILQHDIFDTIEKWKMQAPVSIDAEIKKILRRVNQMNATDDQLETLETKIDQLVRKINRAKFFDSNFDIQALNAHAKYLQVLQIYQKFSQSIIFIKEQKAYFRWMQLWVNLPSKTKKILQQLYIYPSQKWVKAFDRWYLFHLLKHSKPTESLLRADVKTAFSNLSDRYNGLDQENTYEFHAVSVQDAIRKLKKRDPHTYKQIFKKQIELFNYSALLLENMDFVKSVFPILCVEEGCLDQLDTYTNLSFDSIVLDGVSPKAIAPFSNQIDTQIVIIRDDQNPPQGELTFALENIFPKHWVSIADESPGKVLKLAHFFSKALMELNSNYTCFFTKNFTIISVNFFR